MSIGKLNAGDAAEALASPAIDSLEDVGLALVLIVVAAVIAVVIIPLILFGVELILLGLLIAAGIVGRALLGRPWVIRATGEDKSDAMLSWRVTGWRRSAGLIEEVADLLAAGCDPAAVTATRSIASS